MLLRNTIPFYAGLFGVFCGLALLPNPAYATLKKEDPAKIAKAKDILSQIPKINEEVAEDLYQKALWLEEKGQDAQAESTYLMAAKLHPSFLPMIQTQLGLLYRQQGHYDLAEHYLLLAANMAPSSALLQYQLALVYWDAGDKDKAAEFLAKAVTINPDWAQAHYLLGKILWEKDKNAAAKHFRDYLRLDEQQEFREEVSALLDQLPLDTSSIPARQTLPAQKNQALWRI